MDPTLVTRKGGADTPVSLNILGLEIDKAGTITTRLRSITSYPVGEYILAAICEREEVFSLQIFSRDKMRESAEAENPTVLEAITPVQHLGTIEVPEAVVREILTKVVHTTMAATEAVDLKRLADILNRECSARKVNLHKPHS